ncbi:hypothetical protein GGI17_004510 [Coemansia sp. S146]|nr:hypothetical protein GGI17_004510 [Coemansia sp. S146]
MSQAPYDGCAFPLVRKITFFVLMDNMFDNDKAHKNAWLGKDNSTDLLDIEDLISRLFQLVSHATYGDYDRYSAAVDLQMNPVSNLVHIEHISKLIHSSFAQLVQQNSSTLQSLIIKNSNDIDLGAFIKTADDTLITYPRLLTLKLTRVWDYPESPMSAFKDAVPFPCLRFLCLRVGYPFNNDTLFRGNAATLKYLEMGLDSRTISMLSKYNVFTQTSHPKLQHVGFDVFGELVPDPFITYAELVLFMLNVAPRAAVQEIGIFIGCAELVPALLLLGDYTCIQVLILTYACLDHWQAIALVVTYEHYGLRHHR